MPEAEIITPPKGEKLYRYAAAVLKFGFTEKDAATLFGVNQGTIAVAVKRKRHLFESR